MKPDWIDSLPGRNPGLKGYSRQERDGVACPLAILTPDEKALIEAKKAEAEAAANSLRPDLWDEDVQFIAETQRRIIVAQASFATFLNLNLPVEDREAKIATVRRELASAYLAAGEFNEAVDVLSDEDDFDDLREQIAATVEAVYRDDDLSSHDCPRTADTTDKGSAIELDRRSVIGKVLSPRHGFVVSVWCCSQCNELNASPFIPERQGDYDRLRRQAYAEAQLQGRRMSKADREKLGALIKPSAETADERILKTP